jgi:hypothetical protein
MGKRNGQQKGAQTHAEGQHGAKAHARFIESLHEDEGGAPPRPEMGTESRDGGHRLREEREQHDDADRNSEKNRRS